MGITPKVRDKNSIGGVGINDPEKYREVAVIMQNVSVTFSSPKFGHLDKYLEIDRDNMCRDVQRKCEHCGENKKNEEKN